MRKPFIVCGIVIFVFITGNSASWAQQAENPKSVIRASLGKTENTQPVVRASLAPKAKYPFKRHELEFQYVTGSNEIRDNSLFTLSYVRKITPSIGLGFGYERFTTSAMKIDPPGGGSWMYPVGYSCSIYTGLFSVSFFPRSMFDPRITVGLGYNSDTDVIRATGNTTEEIVGLYGIDLKYHATESFFVSIGIKGHSGTGLGGGYGISTGYSFGEKKL